MAVLWLKFAEDSSLPSRMDAGARQRFESIFDTSDPQSPWRRALQQLGFNQASPPEGLVSWRNERPYIHWSHLVSMISAGLVRVEKGGPEGFMYLSQFRLSRLAALLSSQWKVARYIARQLDDQTETGEEIRDSLALGLAMLALTMRLPAHSPQQLAGWLAAPAAAPLRLRRTVMQMQAIQQKRTQLSDAWVQAFPDNGSPAPHDTGAEYVWDNETPETSITVEDAQNNSQWRGMGVCGEVVTGRAYIITRMSDALELPPGPKILIFPLARPQTVECFALANGVLFAEGGLMSHACTIAREQNLPCITGLGKNFLTSVKQIFTAEGEIWMTMDPSQGIVELIPPA